MASKNMTQAELGRRTGWSKATCNDIFHGRTDYYRQILNEAAAALNVSPFELLMHPSEANQLRSISTAVRLAAEQRAEYRAEPPRDGTNG